MRTLTATRKWSESKLTPRIVRTSRLLGTCRPAHAAAKDTSLKPVLTVLPDCWAKNTFSPLFRVKIVNQNLNVGSGASVIQNFEFAVKGFLGCVILIRRRRMGTYKANVKIFCLDADGG